MIIFFYGSDAYRLKEDVDITVGAYQKKHNKSGMNLYRFDFTSDENYGDFESAVKSVSFFNEVKLIVVKGIFQDKVNLKNTTALITDLNIESDKEIVLLFSENKSGKELQKENKEVFGILNGKNNLVKEIEPLGGVKLSNWVKNKFIKNDCNASAEAVSMLIGITRNESWALANEINKLCDYKREGVISEEDVKLLVNFKENDSVFDMIDYVGNRDKAKAFEMMYRLLNSGQDPHYLLSMLIYHFENLLSLSDLPAGKSVGLHPFVAKKISAQLEKFTKKDLLSKFNHLAELDVASKDGNANLEDALYDFAID